MNGMKKSDGGAKNAANNGPPAERREQRAPLKGKPKDIHTHQARDWGRVSQGIDRLRQFVERNPKEKLTTLLHHINVDSLRAAFFALKRKAAPGVDGMTWQMYAEGLESRLAAVYTAERTGRNRPGG